MRLNKWIAVRHECIIRAGTIADKEQAAISTAAAARTIYNRVAKPGYCLTLIMV